MKKPLSFLVNKIWFICFLIFLSIVCFKIIVKGYVIGPFDFLVNFYHPYKEIIWQRSDLIIASMHPKNYLMSDVLTVTLPIKLFTIDLIKKFQLPLWNPYILNGSPILANIQSSVFYPLNIVYLIFKPIPAYNIYVLSQFILAFVFMFFYLRSLKLNKITAYFGGLSFSFSAFFVVWAGWATLGHALLWLPISFYAIESFFNKQKLIYKIIFTIALSFSFFAGHTQTTLVLYFLSLAYLLFKSHQTKKYSIGFNLFIFYLISLLIIAVQLIPAVEMYQQSTREILATESFYKDQTLFFSSYLMSVFPDFFGNPVTGNWWGKINYAESAIYFGTTAFYFFIYQVFSPKNWKKNISQFFIFLTIVSVFISTQNLFSKLIFYLKIPLISSSTFSRYSSIFIFAGSILASFGFSNYIKDLKNKNYKKIFIINFFLTVVILIYWVLVLLKELPPEYISNLSIIKRNSIIPSFFLLIVIILPLLKYFFDNRLKILNEKFMSIIILLLLSFELWRFSYKYIPFSPTQFFFPKHQLIETLKRYADNERYDSYVSTNINSLYGISSIFGAEPLYNKNLGELTSLSKNGKINITDRAAMQIPDGPYKPRVLDLLSMKYFVDKTDNSRNSWVDFYGLNNDFDSRFKEIWTDGIYKIYLNKNYLPRQKLFYQIQVIKDKRELLQKLINNNFDYKNIALVEEKIDLLSAKTGINSIKIIKNEPVWQRYQISTTQSGLFLVTDTYYPGWNAYVDNKKTEIFKTNYAFRGIIIGKGSHMIDFKYQPKSFTYGAIISSIGLFLLVLVSLKKNKK
ncbi:MAG: YfhO family protein [Patescibacteria group bacterium]|jgi:hypothetical protein